MVNQPVFTQDREQEEAAEGGTPPQEHSRRDGGIVAELFEFIWETAKVVLIALVIILPIRYYLVQPFFVKGQSMVPNFQDKEYILVDKWTYRTTKPQRGEVVVFRAPTNPNDFFIKRIVGLPGERVVVENDRIRIYNAEFPNGFTVDESTYLPESFFTAGIIDRTLQEEEYFLLGDNREHSSDSRAFGPVLREAFAGAAWLRLWPLDRIGFIERTVYPPVLE